MINRNALSLSDRQVKALRTYATGTFWEKSRVYGGTRKSLIKRGLLAQKPSTHNCGEVYITTEGRTALTAFAADA